MCLQDCLRDPEKDSQDEIFYSNGTARRKEKCLVFPQKPCARLMSCLEYCLFNLPLLFRVYVRMTNVSSVHCL